MLYRLMWTLPFALLALLPACGRSDAASTTSLNTPHVVAPTPEAAGKYIVMSAGCNDCHTPGFMEKGNQVPEAEWLTGVPLGWRGPWGTSYAANLRLAIQPYDETSWVNMMKVRNGRPPMPWEALHSMSHEDLKSLYAYIKSLGPAGESTPAPVGPSATPKTPYIDMMPQLPPSMK